MTTRPTHLITHSLLALCVVAVVLLGFPGRAAAHNSLLSSSPSDGETLDAPPPSITWVFANEVPLDTLTVTLIDGSGVRTELAGSTHGASTREVVTPLPALTPGSVSIRWRLVGPDGHPVTGSVSLTISSAPSTAPPGDTTGGVGGSSLPATTEPTTTEPDATLPTAPTTPVDGGGDGGDGDDALSTPEPVRWLLRYCSYLAIMGVVGILITSALVWPGAERTPIVAKVASHSLAAIAVLTAAQVAVLASDITGTPPWETLSTIDTAVATDAGAALMVRLVTAFVLWLLMFQHRFASEDVRWASIAMACVGLLGTWAFAGHSRTQRWPALGVVSDVIHHAAAAGWVAGLVLVGGLVAGHAKPSALAPILRRFSAVATTCVGLLVFTGAAQSLRLVGSPTALFDARHGRYLAAKLALVVVMLALGQANRRRVARQLTHADGARRRTATVRRAMLAEFAVGMVVVGITAAMVAAPPAVSGG